MFGFMKKLNNKILMFFVIAVFLTVKNAELCAFENYTVVDGDSLRLGKTEIRLVGIDAPELFQKCYDENDKYYECGKVATKVLQKYVKGGVKCRGKSKDVYNRRLMECFDKTKESINKKMVSEGWAISYGNRFENEENDAKSKKKGIWKGRFMRPELYRALHNKKKNFDKFEKR